MVDFKNPVVSIIPGPLRASHKFAITLTRLHLCVLLPQQVPNLRALTTDAARQLNVLGHDCDALGMNSTQICVLKETY